MLTPIFSIFRQTMSMFLKVSILVFLPFAAFAKEGKSENWQLSFQEPATDLMSDIISFHSYILMPIITGISLLVLGLILLIIIAIPSFRLLYVSETIPKADLTIKAIGNQWYWTYEYPDYEDIAFDANMLLENELSDPKLRLLETDTQIVVPVNKVVKLQITSADVLHAWTIPAFGVKMDAVPGRLNETWFKANKEGIYYGQCSELCGAKHAFMPINVKVVSESEFDDWLDFAKEEYASSGIDYSSETFEIAKN